MTSFQIVNAGDITDGDVIVALIGLTGTGKSNFIDVATMQGGKDVGHGLESCTSDVRGVRFVRNDRQGKDTSVVLLDTPGFDDPKRSDMDVLHLIADWLKTSSKKLSGIIYLHRITDNRMPGSPLINIHMFDDLCGEQGARKVVLATTMWDDRVDHIRMGEQREIQLRNVFWKFMLKQGSSTERFNPPTYESAWTIIDKLVERADPTRQQLDKKWWMARQVDGADDYPDAGTQAHRKHFKGLGHPVSLNAEELSEDDVIIAVMGPTGTGKSTFIRAATGFGGDGHSLTSCTTDIRVVKYHHPDRTNVAIVFVDTPGFDDTNKSDVEVLNMIADWLKKTYQRKIILAGILYFHRISDNRMAGSPLKNLRMFEQLCGKNALQHVILTTTMWDDVDEDTGTSREKQLRENYWKYMLDSGSLCTRFLGTLDSAWSILEPLLLDAEIRHAVLLQEELVDMRMQIPETSAAHSLFVVMEALAKEQKDLLQRIQKKTKRNRNEEEITGLRNEYEVIRKSLDRTLADMQLLKISIGRRLILSFKSRLSFLKKRL